MRWGWLLPTLAISALGLSACGGGQTGDEDALPQPGFFPPTGANQDELCPTTEQGQVLSSLDEASPDGFTAREVLSFAQGPHHSSLRLITSAKKHVPGVGKEELEIRPSSGETALTLELAYDGGALRYFAPEPVGGGCSGRLHIDVQLTLRTADGALDETWPATLEARGPHQASLQVAARRVVSRDAQPLPGQPAVNELRGALEVSVAERGDTQLVWLDARIWLSVFGVQGSLWGWIEGARGDAFLVEFATFGVRCEDDAYGFAIEPDRALPNGLRPQAALDQLEGLTTTPALFQDGARASFALAFDYQAGSACARLDGDYSTALVDSVRLGGTLSLTADNGRIDAQWPVPVTATIGRDSGDLALDFELAATDPGLRPDNLETDWGIRGVAAGGVDRVELALDATLAPADGGAELLGDIVLTGYDLPAMPPRDRPLSSSEIKTTELLRVRIGSGAP